MQPLCSCGLPLRAGDTCSQFCWESHCTSNPGHLPLAVWEWQGLGWSALELCCCWYHGLSWMAGLWHWAGFGKAPHSPQPAPCGLWAEAGALLPRFGLAEEPWVFTEHLVCSAVPHPGLHLSWEPLCSQDLDLSSCRESAHSPLLLSPGRFPSFRKHKPPSSIIHQVLNFIKEPPDT